MKILIIGSGGKEHALVWKLNQSPQVDKIYCAPGNAGICEIADCVRFKATDIQGLLKFADEQRIDLTIVGATAPLLLGITDAFQTQGLPIFAPSQKAVALEGSRVFAKNLLDKYKIPTPQFKVFEDIKEAKEYLKKTAYPIIIKTDIPGSTIVCFIPDEANLALSRIMGKRSTDDKTKRIIIEEYIPGNEVSLSILTDGINYLSLIPTRVYKAVFDGEKGPITEGMGAYATTKMLRKDVYEQLVLPVIRAMALEERPYRGILNTKVIFTDEGPQVIGFNCSWGDPETQAMLPLIKSDLIDSLISCERGELTTKKLKTLNDFAVAVVMAASGYPGNCEIGKKIMGLNNNFYDDLLIFHSGTKLNKGNYITNDGRVLTVTSISNSVNKAIENAYRAVRKIVFDGAYYRKDIAIEAFGI